MASYNDPKVTNAILKDIPAIRELIRALATMNPASGGHKDIPAGAIQLIAVSGGMQFNQFSNNAWKAITSKFLINVDKLDGYNASTTAVKGTIPVYNASALLPGGITGNAATATKLKTAKTIDIGGIASATGQAFDGSSPITIQITQISINNDDDDAINGVLTKAHGGTGRTDGAASDVILANGGKASEYGQIGDAKGIDGKDLNSIVNSGVYMGTKATTANHFPRGTSVSYLLYVARLNTQIRQTLIMRDTEIWTRRSADSGASWEAWHSVGYSSNDTITIYISKSGSDENTGLETAYPLLTIDRALELAKQIYNPRSGKSVNFRVGEGSWGDVTFKSLPYYLFITAYDGNNSTEFSESLPHFGTLSAEHSMVALGSVVCDYLDSNTGSTIYVTEKYYRGSTIRARHGGLCLFNGSSSDPILDIVARSSHDYVFLAYNFGYIAFGSSRKVTVTGNLTLSQAFLSLNTGSFMSSNGAQFSMSSGVKVTGKKYALNYGTSVALRNFSIDNLPGTVAGTKENGAIVNGIPYGGGASDEALMADLSWRPVLLQTGGEASNSLYVRKSNSPNYGLINDGFTLGTDPSSNRYWNLGFYDKNKKALGDILCFHNADSSGGDTAIEFRLLSNDGADFSTVPSMGLVYKKSLNKAYGIAPTPNSDAKSVEIATAAWVRTLLGSYATDADLKKYLPLAGGTMTGSISVNANPLIQSSPWSSISIADKTRTSTTQKIIGQVLDKNSKRFISLEVGAGNTGNRSLSVNGRNRADTGWIHLFQVIEQADGSIEGKLGGKNIVRSINGRTVDVDGNIEISNFVVEEWTNGSNEGYVKYANGRVEQWGFISYNGAIGGQYANDMYINFHTDMPTVYSNVTLTAITGNKDAPCYAYVVGQTSVKNCHIAVFAHNYIGAVQVYWRAVCK